MGQYDGIIASATVTAVSQFALFAGAMGARPGRGSERSRHISRIIMASSSLVGLLGILVTLYFVVKISR